MASQEMVRVDRNLVAVPRERGGKRRFRRHFTRENVTKGVFFVALTGGVVALLANLEDLKNSETAKAHWWLLPVVVMGIGYMLRKRHSPYGTAVLAVGGALFAIAYQIQSKQAQAQQQQQQPPQQPAQPFAPQQFQYRNDVQGPAFPPNFAPPNLANLLPQGGQALVDVPMPDGTVMKVPVLAAIAAALRQRNGAPRPAPAAA